MKWYYASGGQQVGPIDETELARLVAAGAINRATLVWRDGMPQWSPYEQVWTSGMPDWRSAVTEPLSSADTPGSASAASDAQNAQTCSLCNQSLPADELISVEGRRVCAGCKPILLQRLKEGAPMGGMNAKLQDLDPDTLTQIARERREPVEVMACFNRAWEAFKAQPMLLLGTVVVVYLCMGAGGMIPIISPCIGLLINGPLMAGIWIVVLKVLRGEEASIGDAFGGFSKFWWPLVGANFLITVVTVLPLIPFGGSLLFTGLMNRGGTPRGVDFILPGILCLLALPVVIYLTLAWFFAIPLIIDRNYGVWDAMNTSRRVVNRFLVPVFLTMLLSFALGVAGFIALCVGLLVAIPVSMTMIAAMYEELLGTKVRRDS